ncbi:MAG: DUF1566 domain-containing protein [Candidatus Brocadiaceae bacterium]|nr:DUF1566 domain-containing protein [Candidatus Brocadiaceae bacterium]
MNKCKIVGLLLVAFIGLMGFNELTFAAGFVPRAWSQKLPVSARFQLVLGNAAVLDKETGLVWEKSPDTTTRTWTNAVYYAYNKNVGGRGGWRLPTVEELRSLIDPTQSSPALPSGHPFTNVQSNGYWSATTNASSYLNAWHVLFSDGNVGNGFKNNDVFYVWCVRGGHGHDAY